jgi:hypothetical protein
VVNASPSPREEREGEGGWLADRKAAASEKSDYVRLYFAVPVRSLGAFGA